MVLGFLQSLMTLHASSLFSGIAAVTTTFPGNTGVLQLLSRALTNLTFL